MFYFDLEYFCLGIVTIGIVVTVIRLLNGISDKIKDKDYFDRMLLKEFDYRYPFIKENMTINTNLNKIRVITTDFRIGVKKGDKVVKYKYRLNTLVISKEYLERVLFDSGIERWRIRNLISLMSVYALYFRISSDSTREVYELIKQKGLINVLMNLTVILREDVDGYIKFLSRLDDALNDTVLKEGTDIDKLFRDKDDTISSLLRSRGIKLDKMLVYVDVEDVR